MVYIQFIITWTTLAQIFNEFLHADKILYLACDRSFIQTGIRLGVEEAIVFCFRTAIEKEPKQEIRVWINALAKIMSKVWCTKGG